MGCISSKILTRSGTTSLQEKAEQGSFRRSGLIEEIILSNSKSNGDQFLVLLRASTSASAPARRSKDNAAGADQSPAAAAARIETINVSELLAGLEEENAAEEEEEDDDQERRGGQEDGGKASPRCACASDGAAVGRAKNFRTVEEFDALVTRSGSSTELAKPATALAPERADASVAPPPPQSSSSEQEEPRTAAATSNQDATAIQSSASESEQVLPGGAKRRARARQLAELSAPAAAADFDFSKSGSLRDWLLGGGQIFSPGSYITPKFGNVEPPPPPPPPPPESEHGGRLAGERQQQRAVFDPELVAQLEQAMEELSVDEERVLKEVLEVLEAGEKGEKETLNDQQVVVVQD